MPTRREVLMGTVAAGAAALVGPAFPAFAKGSPAAAPANFTPVDFEVPKGACDCHVHIFGDAHRFPFSPARTYTPGPALVKELRTVHRALHTERVVIVQPSVYGTDNSCALDAIKQHGSSARGIAVIDDKISDPELDKLHHAGFRGLRLIFPPTSQTDPAVVRQRLQGTIDRVKAGKWHIQIYMRLAVMEDIKDLVTASPVPVVFDHFGGAQASLGVEQPGFETLLKLVQAGKVYVKISGAYRSSTQAPDYPDVAPFAKALIAANPQRILWGTDWPHVDSAPAPDRKPTDIAPFFPIDDGRLFNLLPTWAPDPAQRKTILVQNPTRLYGF